MYKFFLHRVDNFLRLQLIGGLVLLSLFSTLMSSGFAAPTASVEGIATVALLRLKYLLILSRVVTEVGGSALS